MGQISDSAVIILCIVGAGAALLIGWAVGHRIYTNRDGDVERSAYAPDNGPSQYEYMRDLRERNKENIAAVNLSQQPKRARQQPMPMSTTDLSGHSQSHY